MYISPLHGISFFDKSELCINDKKKTDGLTKHFSSTKNVFCIEKPFQIFKAIKRILVSN